MRTPLLLLLTLLIFISCNPEKRVRVLDTTLPSHPRLLYIPEDQQKIDKLWASEPLLDSLRTALFQKAELLLDDPLAVYDLKEFNYVKHMLAVSRQQLSRMITLCMAYRLTGDTRFSDRAEKDLLHICEFPNWNPDHYLDVSEMTTCVSIGYDWLYHILSPATKEKIVVAIKTKALDEAVETYATGDKNSWAKRETNWNVVCNSGMVIGALAIAEHYPELCGEIIQNALKYLPNCLDHFAPDGVCYEGPGYWSYTNMYLSFLMKVLNDNFGQDFGLTSMKGIDKTAMYYIESVSPSGRIFNFANTGGIIPTTHPIYFFFSKHYNQPEVALFYRNIISDILKNGESTDSEFFLSIPWFDPASPAVEKKLPRLSVYQGVNDIVVFNGDRSKKDFIYLTAKTGRPDMAHQQMDVGTFIVETNGVRWSDDLGADHYSLPGFWDYRADGMRWKYFRNTNFSHNTLSIDGKIQYSHGQAEILSVNTVANSPSVTMDLTPVYNDQASFVHRTFEMSGEDLMTVTDSIGLNTPSQAVRWSMITSAAISVNGKSATLSKEGHTFHLRIVSPGNARFIIRKAKAFSPLEKPVEGFQLLTVDLTGNRHHTLRIAMTANKDRMK